MAVVNKSQVLEQNFYLQDTIEVARKLLGKILVVEQSGKRLKGIITETEAYLGLEDPACHSSHGKITERTKTFYLPGGYSYVYMIYGMYHCFNVVTGNESQPEAVLVRAVLPVEGVDEMRKRSPHIKKDAQLANGPGKLCRAFGIDKSLNEHPLFNNKNIFILDSPQIFSESEIKSSPRIGIDYAGDAAHWPLRFWVPGPIPVSNAKF